jgi:hypothetical protein
LLFLQTKNTPDLGAIQGDEARNVAGLWHSGWRRIVALLLAYALAIQGLAAVVLVGVGGTVTADGSAAFQLCTHQAADSTQPNLPSQAPDFGIHCIFCLAGTFYVNSTLPFVPHWNRFLPVKAVFLHSAPSLAAPAVNGQALPRGPPSAV